MDNLFDQDEECIITSITNVKDGFVMVGSVKNTNYRIFLMKTNRHMQKIWKKSYGAESSDYEGQNIVSIKDGYLICGSSEGHASKSGGSDWKAYILKTDHNGNTVWDKSYRIKGNDCFYSLAVDDDIFLYGETSSTPEKRHLFLLKVDTNGNIIWQKIFETGEETNPGGLVKVNSDYIIAGSFKRNNKWITTLRKIDRNGEILFEEIFENTNVYDICEVQDGYVMTGNKNEDFYVIKTDKNGKRIWDRTDERGCGVAIERIEERLMVAGDIEKDEMTLPVLYRINLNGTTEWFRIYDKEGFIETLKRFKEGLVLVRHILTPREYTDIIEIDENGSLK
jgi:hypothetical protein